MKTVARLAAFCVLLAGVFVQSLAIAVSFDRPILAVPNDNARYFHPSSSPITVSLFTVQRQWQRWRMWRFPPANTMRLETGFRSPESDNPAASFPRWTDGAASVSLHPRAGSALRVKLTYFDHRPGSQRTVATPVEVFLGDVPLTAVDRLPIAPGNEGFILAYDLSPALLHDAGDRLFIRSPTWNPGTAGAGERHEVLGIFVNNLEVWADGVPLEIQRTPSLPPIPATPHAIWLWANFPNTPHLLDWWPVLLYDAQMPHGATAMLSSGILGFTACLLGVGMWLLRSAPTPRLESLSVGKGSSVVSDS